MIRSVLAPRPIALQEILVGVGNAGHHLRVRDGHRHLGTAWNVNEQEVARAYTTMFLEFMGWWRRRYGGGRNKPTWAKTIASSWWRWWGPPCFSTRRRLVQLSLTRPPLLPLPPLRTQTIKGPPIRHSDETRNGSFRRRSLALPKSFCNQPGGEDSLDDDLHDAGASLADDWTGKTMWDIDNFLKDRKRENAKEEH